MNTIEYLQAVKTRLNITSDYALAQHLGMSKQAIGANMKGKSTLSDETAAKVAAILEVHPGIVMLDMHRERASSPEQASIWNEITKGFLLLLPHANWTTA